MRSNGTASRAHTVSCATASSYCTPSATALSTKSCGRPCLFPGKFPAGNPPASYTPTVKRFRSKSSKLRITRATPSSRASTAGARRPGIHCHDVSGAGPPGGFDPRNGIFDDHATRRSKPDRASRFQVNVRIRLTGQCSVVIDDLFRIEPTLQTETTDEEGHVDDLRSRRDRTGIRRSLIQSSNSTAPGAR